MNQDDSSQPKSPAPQPPSLWDTIASREAQLLALVEGSAQIVWATDANGSVLSDPPPGFAHLTWSRFTGLEQSEIRGFGWRQAIHPEDLPNIQTAVAHAVAHGQPVHAEMRVRHHSGEWRWMIVRGSPIRAADGKVAGWMGTCTDITSSKQTEAALRESQERLVAALAAGEMGTWIWRFDDNTFWWDEASVKLWGRERREETEHDVYALLHYIHPDDRAAAAAAMESFARTGEPSMVEYRTNRSDGALQWLASRGRIERDAAGKATHAVGAFIDITKMKAVQESLRASQKLQALGTLAGGIAHDFNNLILAISGNTKLALSELGAQHAAAPALHEALKAGQRAADLVRRILSFASQPKATLSYTVVDVAIAEALNFTQATLPTHIALETEFNDGAMLEVPLDSVELQQVILNLVGNAIHAIGERPGRIVIRVSSKGESARIAVTDTGCGIESAALHRIFDPFFSTKPTSQGTGLGLSVVHGIVTSVGGAVDVKSTVGVGSEFIVTLPAQRRAAGNSAAIDAPAPPRGRGQHILYVDDDESLVMLMTRMLEKLGYRVTGFADPVAAVQAFSASPEFDAVVTDLSMPQMNGFDVAAAVKAARPDVPVVMTSGFVQPQEEARARQLGMQGIILKPNTVDELAQSLAQLFSR